MSSDELKGAIQTVAQGSALAPEAMESVMGAILAGEATPVQIAALAMALRVRGETAEEIAAAARVMRRRAESVPLPVDGGVLLDTCGTGGDGSGSFNVSTVAAIAVAACGVRVAKHGNRAVSSRSGSADVLEALGVRLDLSPSEVARCVQEVGIGFMFAPRHHPAMKHAAPVRRELGIRTFFNLLGPLSNPAGATHQLLGVYAASRVRQMAEVLCDLGARTAWVVHGDGGLDEVSPTGPTQVAMLQSGRVSERVIRPEDFGLPVGKSRSLEGGDAATNADIARAVLSGSDDERRLPVVLNAAAALAVAEETTDLPGCAARVSEALESGKALRTLDLWIACSQGGDGAGLA